MNDGKNLFDFFDTHATIFGFESVPKVRPDKPDKYCYMEAYCAAPHDAPMGSFRFLMVADYPDEEHPLALWKSPVRCTPADLHEGLRALALARAVPRFPEDVTRVADLCFSGARGSPGSLKELMTLGLNPAEYESWQRELAPSAGMLDSFHIPHNLPKSRPFRKR